MKGERGQKGGRRFLCFLICFVILFSPAFQPFVLAEDATDVPEVTAPEFAPGAPQTLEELRASDFVQVSQIAAFDSRNYGVVPPTKDQGRTNLCWSYAAITAAEISIHRQGIDPNVTPDTLRLSPELLGLARHNRGADPLGNVKGEYTSQAGDYLYTPGDTSLTPSLFSQWVAPILLGGSSSGDLYSQCAYKLSAAVQPCTFNMSKDSAIAAIKQNIVRYGAVTASYNNLRETDYYNPRNESGSGSSPHACIIIGWDDNIPAERFVPGGATRNGGWLVKNSYSSLPYFWLSYDYTPGSETWAFSFVPKSTYDFNYFYDCTAQDFGLAVSKNITTGANVFTAKKGTEEHPEYLKAVQVAFQGGTNAVCEISVYTGLTDPDNPESGVRAGETIVSDTLERQGYYTVALPQDVLLSPGELFSIVVTVRGTGTPVLRMSQDSSNGKSWKYRNGSWSKEDQAIRIKALTVLGEASVSPPEHTHIWTDDWEKDSVCHWHRCTECNEIVGEKESHVWDEGKVTTPPTADAEGVKTYLCTVCQAVRTEVIPPTDDNSGNQTPSDKPSQGGNSGGSGGSSSSGQKPDLPQQSVDEKPGATEQPTLWVNPFVDVKEGAWYYEAVKYVGERKLFSGTSNTTFSPDSAMTRGMLVTVLYHMEGQPDVKKENSDPFFTDVNTDDYYGAAVHWASVKGIVSGYGNDQFGPEDFITREQFAEILYRYAGSPASSGTLAGFTDADKAENYAVNALCWAVEQKMIQGKGGGVLDPKGCATRVQVASILKRFCEITEK